jgi:diadenosine tetraphosphate (Ap4A) HIT family hydrolase
MDWTTEFFALKEGVDCPMCANADRDDTGFGIRFWRGRVSDAYLQRAAIQRGYTVVIWRGRHIVEPTQLTDDEAGAYWADVLAVARAIESRFKPVKMNYQTQGNALPHLHSHVIPRYEDDPRPGLPFPFPDPGSDPGVFPESELQAAVVELSLLARSTGKPD